MARRGRAAGLTGRVPGGLPVAGMLLAATLLLAGCASLPTDYPRTPSTTLTDTQGSRLGQVSSRLLAEHPELSAVLLLERGTDAFLARLALAKAAERSLDIQYYIWHDDATGKVLLDAVLRAAERGVRVRLLLDDIGTAADDRYLLAIDGHPNIEVRLFNPVATRSIRLLGALTDFSRVNRRMHNKSFTADNQTMIVGGRNVGDEYFEARPDVEFTDLDLLAIGPVVTEVSRQFDQYWNSPHAYPITALAHNRPSDAAVRDGLAGLRQFVQVQRESDYAQALKASGLAEGLAEGSLPFRRARVRVVADAPEKIAQEATDASARLLPDLQPEFKALASELVIVSPYFIPGEEGVAKLRSLVERGVKVRVLTNSLASTDVTAVYAGYLPYRRALLEAGVELHEFKPTAARKADKLSAAEADGEATTRSLAGSSRASLHAKSLVFDRRVLFVGSMNLDPRSVFTNTEIGVVVEHAGLAASQVEKLDRHLPKISYRLELVPADGPGGPSEIQWIDRQDGVETRYSKSPMTSAWQRLKIWFLSLLPLEPLL